MATVRFNSLSKLDDRKAVSVDFPKGRNSEIFAYNVFDRAKMKEYLSKEAYESVVEAMVEGTRIERKIADQVAAGMKAWALDRKATHYTHWFHPLNGATAEKHDAFLELDEQGQAFENFDGNLLVQQEPDASSFPSGGIRNTFEARGYSAWDPTSPAFIVGKTLCIPTIFISYTGEALDYKTPLLKSVQSLDKAATEICQYFDKNVEKTWATLGWEQEYFLVDEALFNARPDLALTGRTLMGHASAKDQQLEDHYFGDIPERVMTYMQELEIEAHKLGIPIRTRHNEVAPNQFECAPMYEEANLAVDHNQLLMSIMKKIARKHSFHVLYHEKPFKGVNGSGKHNNWSLMTNTGVNLLKPGKNPKANLQFLTFLVNTVKAVHDHADLLRASIVSEGNSHRMGANEAPPSIVSVFIGAKLDEILNEIEERVSDKKMTPDEKTALKLDIGKIPEILLDNTDRNRTSPFAFTGNRFEFRAVGASANCSAPMVVLNTAVANQLKEFKIEVEALIEKNIKKDEAIFQILRKYIIDSKNIRFEGNGYSDEWIVEAEKKGLSNIGDVPEALKAFLSKSTIELFKEADVLSERELEARYEIKLETFIKKLQIEARVFGDLAINHIIPTALQYQNILMENIRGIKELFSTEEFESMAAPQKETVRKISTHINGVRHGVKELVAERKRINELSNIAERASGYSQKIKPALEDIRYHVDKLERIVDDRYWPLPKYRELMFNR